MPILLYKIIKACLNSNTSTIDTLLCHKESNSYINLQIKNGWTALIIAMTRKLS